MHTHSSMMASKRSMLGMALAACLLAGAAHSVSGQALAAASAGKASGAVASVGKLPAARLAGQCLSAAGASPWDVGNRFPNVIVCCGANIGFQWSGLSSVWQIASRACPAVFRNTTTTKQLIPQSQGSGGVKSLYLPVPGTYYFTSATPGACSGGLVFEARVPPGSGSVCPATPVPAPIATTPSPTAAPTAPNAAAAAFGPPGGTSTSTAPGASAAASGPPGTSRTATAPGMSFSSAGNFGRKLKAAVTGMAV